MRPTRLPVLLFATTLLIMVASVLWLLWVSNTAPSAQIELPPAKQSPGTTSPTGLTAMPQTPAATAPTPAPARPAAAPGIATLNVPGSMPNEALLTFRTPEALAAFRNRAAALGLEVLGYDIKLRTARVRFRDTVAIERDLNAHAEDYTHVGPNLITRIPGLPPPIANSDTSNPGGSVPFRSQGLDVIGASGDRSGWGQGVTVAVIDSGITSHPSLASTTITHYDLVNDGSTFNGHGTAMASLIAGNDPNVGGVSPAVRLLDIRVADTNGVSNTALVSSAIIKATDLGARVINISLGANGSSPVLDEAVRYAQSRNVVIVAAAGNEQLTALSMPAGISGVLSVGAVDANGTQAYFSNSGAGLTLVAPGVGIVSGYADNRFVIGSGTSQATAITSGVVAYLLGRGYYGPNIIPLLTRTAEPLQAPATAVGAGLIQVPK
ncbi:MAG: S8 family serine peptidase [Prosthecobacter sp.]|uniref:S8 family peptidase n=1 Tax=Prosthecobacter sp. TaxID=1965333 RepID=UPI0025D61845|nr:S8 family serine peptidase [Prosthecobacter sp.]MCF7788068.1 S8 family serine peptidase [Prosthecobacter sp.]